MRKLTNDELKRLTIDEYKKALKNPVVIVLDNIRSQNNIGSIFRTCDAFRVEELLLCGITATPPAKEIQKTALGATESVEWKYFEKTEDAINYLRNKDYIIVSIEQVENSIMLQNFIPEKNRKYAFVFGNEIKGVQQSIVDISDYCVEIPQFGTKHSFNVTISVGIVLWDVLLKMGFIF